jgi:hypothetical protein
VVRRRRPESHHHGPVHGNDLHRDLPTGRIAATETTWSISNPVDHVAAFLYGLGFGPGFVTYLGHGTVVVVSVAAFASVLIARHLVTRREEVEPPNLLIRSYPALDGGLDQGYARLSRAKRKQLSAQEPKPLTGRFDRQELAPLSFRHLSPSSASLDQRVRAELLHVLMLPDLRPRRPDRRVLGLPTRHLVDRFEQPGSGQGIRQGSNSRFDVHDLSTA